MVNSDAGITGEKKFETIGNFIRVNRDIAPTEPEPEQEEFKEIEPEQGLAKPDVPSPDIAPPSPVANLAFLVPPPDLSLAANGISSLGKIPGSSRGRLQTPAIASNLVPTLRIPPIYPQQALRDGLEGIVTIEFTVVIDGSMKNPKVVKTRSNAMKFSVEQYRRLLASGNTNQKLSIW